MRTVSLISTPKFKFLWLTPYSTDGEGIVDEETALDKKSLVVLTSDRGDAAMRYAHEGLFPPQKLLIIIDDALIRNTEKSCTPPLQVKNSPNRFFGKTKQAVDFQTL